MYLLGCMHYSIVKKLYALGGPPKKSWECRRRMAGLKALWQLEKGLLQQLLRTTVEALLQWCGGGDEPAAARERRSN